MKNLEQIRAKNALNVEVAGGANDGAVVKKVPTMIMNNGIIAAAAFSKETGKGYADVFVKGIIPHLADTEVKLLNSKMNLDLFIGELTESSSSKLRQITTETMAYLSYLRRFAK